MESKTLLEKYQEFIGKDVTANDIPQDLTSLIENSELEKFIKANQLPPTTIKHLIVTTEHSGYRVTGGIGSYVKECDHLYGDDVGILVIDSNRDINMEMINANRWLAAQSFLTHDRIDVIDSANFDTLGDLVFEVLENLLRFYPGIESIESQEMLLHRTIEAKKLGYINTDIKLITTCHGSSFHLAKAKRDVLEAENIHVAYREKFTIEESDVTIFPTRFLLESYRDSGLKNLDDASRVIKRLPFDYERIPLGSELHQYKRLIYIGKTSTIKGFNLFLETLLKLHDECPEICQQIEEVLVIATSTNIVERYLQELYRQVSERFNIRMVSLDREELLQSLSVYSADSLALITYKGDNHPLTVLEFMAIGHDFLAARAGGTPELIPDQFKKDFLVEANEEAFIHAVKAAFSNTAQRIEKIKALSRYYRKQQDEINNEYSIGHLRNLTPRIAQKAKTAKPNITVLVIDTGSRKLLNNTLKSIESQSLKPATVRVCKYDELDPSEEFGNQLVMRLYAGDTLSAKALEEMSRLLLADDSTGAALAYELVPTYLGAEFKGYTEFHPFAPELGSVFLQEKYGRRFVGLFKGETYRNNDFTDWQKCIDIASQRLQVRIVPRLHLRLTELPEYVSQDILKKTSNLVHSFSALPVFDAYILHSELKRFDDLYWGSKLTNHLEDIYIRRDDPSILHGSTPALAKTVDIYRNKTPKIVRKGISFTTRNTYKALRKVKRKIKRNKA